MSVVPVELGRLSAELTSARSRRTNFRTLGTSRRIDAPSRLTVDRAFKSEAGTRTPRPHPPDCDCPDRNCHRGRDEAIGSWLVASTLTEDERCALGHDWRSWELWQSSRLGARCPIRTVHCDDFGKGGLQQGQPLGHRSLRVGRDLSVGNMRNTRTLRPDHAPTGAAERRIEAEDYHLKVSRPFP